MGLVGANVATFKRPTNSTSSVGVGPSELLDFPDQPFADITPKFCLEIELIDWPIFSRPVGIF